MSCMTKMERTGCDTRTTIQMRPFNEKLSSSNRFLSTEKKIQEEVYHTHQYNIGELQQILQVTAMKIKRIALDMNESPSVTRLTATHVYSQVSVPFSGSGCSCSGYVGWCSVTAWRCGTSFPACQVM